MSDNNSNAETNKYLFVNLVTMLSITAMQQLGKLVNPAIGKTGVNLEAAQTTIDTLDMLFHKTEGKLDNDEARLMKDTLAALKMNYVETREMKFATGKSAGGGNEKPAQSGGAEEAKPEPPAQEKSEASGRKPGAEQGNDPKFHKSYD